MYQSRSGIHGHSRGHFEIEKSKEDLHPDEWEVTGRLDSSPIVIGLHHLWWYLGIKDKNLKKTNMFDF